MLRFRVTPYITGVFQVLPQSLGLKLESGFQNDMMSESVMNLWEFLMNDVTNIFSCRGRTYVWLYKDVVAKRYMMSVWWDFVYECVRKYIKI